MMTNSAIVWVVQRPHPRRPLDLSTAENFGELKYLFDFIDGVSTSPDKSYLHAVNALRDFDEDTDYLLDCGGDKMALGVAVHVLAFEYDIPIIKFLRWDRIQQSYLASHIGEKE